MFGLALATGLLLNVQFTKTTTPIAPNSVVVVACRVDDMGSLDVVAPGVHGPGARDIKLHIENGVYECKRDIIANIVDAAAANNPELKEITPNFGSPGRCASIGVTFVPDWQDHHPGWAVVGLGCPSPMINSATGDIVGWKLPGCPDTLPGTDDPMKCEYDGSEI